MPNENYKRWHKPNMTGTVSEGGTSRTKQGYYRNLKNPEKYIGDPNLIIYRSSWEFSFIKWCDASPSIIKWSSEPIKVPYYDRVSKLEECRKLGLDPNNPRNWTIKNYNTDFWVLIDKGGERPEKWFIEIKPKDKLTKPKQVSAHAPLKEIRRYNNLMKEYLINEAKFAALKDWAEKNQSKFYVFTEDTLIHYGIIGGRFDYDNEKTKYQQRIK
ncbi:MAG: hypothetical protein GYA51_12165 [Candidatus Methanofastidiosa archaeon]|jgi:hypothetical protein|nr:hypothetical protein [Candidatus Methanofastidiosa archaeon]